LPPKQLLWGFVFIDMRKKIKSLFSHIPENSNVVECGASHIFGIVKFFRRDVNDKESFHVIGIFSLVVFSRLRGR
jgi:Ni,Fe-hydrogenase III small subunit